MNNNYNNEISNDFSFYFNVALLVELLNKVKSGFSAFFGVLLNNLKLIMAFKKIFSSLKGKVKNYQEGQNLSCALRVTHG